MHTSRNLLDRDHNRSLRLLLREQSVAQTQREDQQRVLYRAHRFERLIRTLPPENFLEVVADFYSAAAAATNAAFSERVSTPHPHLIVEQSLRHLLRIIAALAQQFDGSHADVEYAANIMLFKEPANLSPVQRDSLQKRLLFCDEGVGIEHLRGVLELQISLSAVASDANAAPDPRMTPIVLPVPKEPLVSHKYKVIPGAPLAFVDDEPDIYTDTRLLAQWCEEYGDFTQQVVQQIRDYFATSHVRAFVSIPLSNTETIGNAGPHNPCAVLNIHATRRGLLRGESEPLAHFVQILRPFQRFIVELLRTL